MKKASMVLATLGMIAVIVPAVSTPADAYTKSVRYSRGYYGGHGCRTARITTGGRYTRRTVVHRYCH